MVYVGDISTVFMGLETNKHNLGGTTLHGFSAWIEIPSLRRWSFFLHPFFRLKDIVLSVLSQEKTMVSGVWKI